MSRPRKATVDYFPHFANTGKTIFTLESMYGNDGYAFWFKLLELLATSEGHCFRYGNPADWLYLVSKTRVSEEKAGQILKTLADLGAICPELLADKIIWCENLVTNLRPVYSKRKEETPCRPEFPERKPKQGRITATGKPQSKVKESKVEKSKDNPPTPQGGMREKKRRAEDFIPYAEQLARIISTLKNIHHTTQQINSWANEFRKLADANKVEASRIQAALDWYQVHAGEQYVPVIESGNAFREKFVKLEDAIKRDGKDRRDDPFLGGI